MLNEEQAFKFGVMQSLINAGVPQEEWIPKIKEAAEKVGSIFQAMAEVAKPIAGAAIPLAIAAPPVLGALGGYGMSLATDIDATDVEDIKSRELERAYQTETDRLRREKAIRDYRKARAQKYRPYYG